MFVMTSDPTIDRRVCLALLALGAIAAPRTAVAQQASTARIGWLAPESRPDALDPFRQAMKDLGWVESNNVTDGSPSTRAAQLATTTIPQSLLMRVDQVIQ